MKKSFLFLVMCLMAIGTFAASTNYWPYVPTKWPVNLGVGLGKSAYVVGLNEAAVAGSIAIGDGDGVAYVLDATNACQIGQGVNTNANTLQYRGQRVMLSDVAAITGETNVVVSEFGNIIRQAVMTVDGVSLVIDGSSGAGWGTAKIGTFPAGRIAVLGVTVQSMAITPDGGDLAEGEGGDFSLGSSATADNSLSGTEVNLCPSTSLDPIQTAVTSALAASAQIDGTSTAVPIYANFLVDDADVAALSTNTFDAVVTVTYVNLGDY